MNGYDFYVDSDQLLTLKSELASKISAVEASLEGMETAVISMSTQDGWVSDVYTILSEKFTTRKEALQFAISYLKAYESTITMTAEKADALATQISTACSVDTNN
jgi:hypothetical protein